MTKMTRILSATEASNLLSVLEERFHKNMHRHPNLAWSIIARKLDEKPEKLWVLNEMENTGGAPDVVDLQLETEDIVFCDCSAETPVGRRSVSYDLEGQLSRKEHQPKNNAVDLAREIGIELLTETQYRALQKFGPFDTKTSSWIATPHSIRALGGALFGDYRYGQVFIYHNGAQSYYGARAFRGLLKV